MRTSTTAKTAALAAVLAILSSAGAPPARAADAGPIKVALLAPTSGSAAAAGHDMVAGWTLYWKEHNDKVAGRAVQTTVYDTASNAAHALDQARHAVEQDGAQIVVGPYLANEGLAVAPYTIQHRVPLFLPTVSADDLSQRMANAFVIKVAGWSSSLPTHPAGEWAYEQGHRKMVTLANSYAFGYENAGGFAQTFTQKGGKVIVTGDSKVGLDEWIRVDQPIKDIWQLGGFVSHPQMWEEFETNWRKPLSASLAET